LEKTVRFYSEGTQVAAILGVPDDLGPGERRGAIVFAHGFSMVKEIWLLENARRLRREGYVTLNLDYRGFGESGGEPRQRLIPQMQVTDVRNAMTYLETLPEVRADRIALYGTSFGAGIVSYAAGVDDRARATVATAGPGDLERVYRQGPGFEAFMEKVKKARATFVATGDVTHVSTQRLMSRDPGTVAELEAAKREAPSWRGEVTFESLIDVVAFKPESVVERIAPRAICWIHPEKDALVPLYEAQSLFAKARDPRRLVVLEGMEHAAIYVGEGRDRVIEETIKFFREHCPAR
jgi:fermentation-respiration switch protein FrsA (DUF1100 family)